MKKTVVWIFRIIGVYLILGAFLWFISKDIMEYSLHKSKGIEKIFQYTAKKIEKFRLEKNLYPTAKEFEEWKDELAEFGLYGEILKYYSHDYPSEAISEFGQPKDNGFVLAVWRGEWFEYYASWNSRSTLPKSLADYYATGNRWGDFILFISIGLVLFAGSFYLKHLTSTFQLGDSR